jgi:hypothetical protein
MYILAACCDYKAVRLIGNENSEEEESSLLESTRYYYGVKQLLEGGILYDRH